MTVSVLQARNNAKITPILLVEITLKNSGGIHYFSDRNIKVGTQQYDDYIANTVSLNEELRREDSIALNSDISLQFKNDKYKTYDYLILIGDTYPFENAKCVIKEVYMLESGSLSDTETLFVGYLDSPQDIDLLKFICKISSAEFLPTYKNRIMNG